MKAIVWTKYGSPDGLQLREVEKPTPKNNEVLIKIVATTVSTGDCELRSLKVQFLYRLPMRLYVGYSKPKRMSILGQEIAGDVEAVGKTVTRFKTGDAVLAPTLLRLGGYAEYVCLPETYPALKPAGMTYEQAATIPLGGINGLHFIRKGNIQAGQKVLIIGAGGSIGTYAVQIAKSLGAEVTGVDGPGKLDMLRSIGADRVIDYTQGDYLRSGESYDAIIDVLGRGSFAGCVRSLKPNGYYVLGNPGISAMIRARWTALTTHKKVIFEAASYRAEGFTFLKELIEAGKLKPVIDRTYPLEQMAEAHRYVDQGQKKGNVVIIVVQSH